MQKTRRKEHTDWSHTHSNLSQEKKPRFNQQRRLRGAARRQTHTQAKPTQSPRKPQYSQRGRPRGSKEREDTHTQAKNSEPRRPQYSQQRRPRETHLNHNKKDRNEKSPTTLPIRPLAPHWCWEKRRLRRDRKRLKSRGK